MPLIRGVKLGPSGSKQREDRASEKLLPSGEYCIAPPMAEPAVISFWALPV